MKSIVGRWFGAVGLMTCLAAGAAGRIWSVAEGYFVKNTYAPPGGSGYLVCRDATAFEAVFQKVPPLMHQAPVPAADLEANFVVAVVKQGNQAFQLAVRDVRVAEGVLTLDYTCAVTEKHLSWVQSVPLIVQVDRSALAGLTRAVFVENGTVVHAEDLAGGPGA